MARWAAGHEYLAVNALGETCMAPPAVSQGALLFRTRSRLIAVAHKAQ